MIVYLLFFLSGISGLIYEVVWLRILTRVLGSTVYATSIILASFMAGISIGSYLFGRYGDRIKDKLHLYALLEALIALSALTLTLSFNGLVPIYRAVYLIVGGDRLALTICQSMMIFLILLIPTSLMGGTLPILSAYTNIERMAFGTRLGYLYGLNTLGAFLGVLASGIYLIGAVGETLTLSIAVLISSIVSVIAFAWPCEREGHDKSNVQEEAAISQYDGSLRRLALIACGSSGFVAMSYEVIWARIFQIHIGTSIYAFSLMLAFYLAGIGLGSLAGARYAAIGHANPLALFGLSQLFIALYGITGMYILSTFDPHTHLYNLVVKNMLIMPASIVFPIAFISGWAFPLIMRSYVEDETHALRGVGVLYSVNTLGCIFGSLISGFILISLLGTRNALLALSLLSAAIGTMLFYKTAAVKLSYKTKAYINLFAAGTVLLGTASPDPFMSAVKKTVKRSFGKRAGDVRVYYHKEDVLATTTVFGLDDEPIANQLLINGIGMTSLCLETKLMAHLPILFNRSPEDILVICFGMGTALRSAWVHEPLKCDVVELVSAEYECFKYFHSNGPDILKSPRVRHYVDDGRNFLLMRPKKYDVITVDPSPPIYSAGTVSLYTKEFFRLSRDRLKDGGAMCLWIPPAPFSEVRMIMKTFHSVFPNTYVCGGPQYPGLYMLGFISVGPPNLDRFVSANRNKAVVADLNEWNNAMPTPQSLLTLLVLKPDQLASFVDGAKVITDDRPYTEYPLWRSIYDKTYRWKLDAVRLNSLKTALFTDVLKHK